MSFGAPFSPSERLSKMPAPPWLICWASAAPIVNNPSPGWAAIAMIFPGFWDDDSPHADDPASADRATAPPTDCAKERRFIDSSSEFESSSCRGSANSFSSLWAATGLGLAPRPDAHSRRGSRFLLACLQRSSLVWRRAVVRARTSPSAKKEGTDRRRWPYLRLRQCPPGQ